MVALLFQTSRRQVSSMAKFGPEQGSKQRIPPTFIKNWGIPRTFWVPSYKNTYFTNWVCNHKVDKKPQNSEKPVFLMASFEACTKQQCCNTVLLSPCNTLHYGLTGGWVQNFKASYLANFLQCALTDYASGKAWWSHCPLALNTNALWRNHSRYEPLNF